MARDTSKLVTIPGELHSAATGNIVAAAEEVFDYTTNKYQNDINQEVAYIKEDSSVAPIPSFNPQSQTVHLDEQVLSNAQKKQVRKNIGLGNGDIDSTPTAESDNVVRSGGVYASMQELRSTVNPQVGYYTCSTAGNTAAKVIDVSGYTLLKGGGLRVNFTEKNTAANATLNIEQTGAKPLYYNGVRASTNNSWYAGEVMTLFYDGAAFQLNSLPDLDEYDVSARNGGQTFTFEEAVALVPEAYRHGGLKLRFISNSDNNKYVQYRLMADNFSFTESDWQGVDDVPTAGSDNLVKSGGVYSETSRNTGYINAFFHLTKSDLYTDKNHRIYGPFKAGTKIKMIVSNDTYDGSGQRNINIHYVHNGAYKYVYILYNIGANEICESTIEDDTDWINVELGYDANCISMTADITILYGSALVEFDDVTLEANKGSQLDIALQKNDGTDENPNYRQIAALQLPSATEEKAGLMSAGDKSFIGRIKNVEFSINTTFINEQSEVITGPFKAGTKILLYTNNFSKNAEGTVVVYVFNGSTYPVRNYYDEIKECTLLEDCNALRIGLNVSEGITAASCDVILAVGSLEITKFKAEHGYDIIPIAESADNSIKGNIVSDMTLTYEKGKTFKPRRIYGDFKQGSVITMAATEYSHSSVGQSNVRISAHFTDNTTANAIILYNVGEGSYTFAKDADYIEVIMGYNISTTDFSVKVSVRYGCINSLINDINSIHGRISDITEVVDTKTSVFMEQSGEISDYMYTSPCYVGFNKPFTKRSLLKSLTMNYWEVSQASIGDSRVLVVGTIDQRNWLLVEKEYTVTVKSRSYWNVTFDLNNIEVQPGQVVFLKSEGFNTEIPDVNFGMSTETYDADNPVYYTTDLNSALQIDTSRGLAKYKLEIAEIDSIFITEQSLDNINQNIDTLQQETNKINSYTDTITGEPYKIKIVNGQVVAQLLNFHKILIIGHSFVTYPNAPSADWYLPEGQNRAMAPSIYDNEWAAFVAEKYGAQLTKIGGVDFERNYSPTFNFAQYWNVQDEWDAICVYLCENANYNDTMQASWEAMLNYLKAAAPHAEIFCTASWTAGDKATAIAAACASVSNINYVNLIGLNSNALSWNTGDYYIGRDDKYLPMGAPAGHPSDIGHLAIANKFLEKMGQTPFDNKTKNVTLNQSGGGTISTKSEEQVIGAVVSIRCTADSGNYINGMTVTDANGNNVETVLRINGFYVDYPKVYYTFIMPNSNVTITPTWSSTKNYTTYTTTVSDTSGGTIRNWNAICLAGTRCYIYVKPNNGKVLNSISAVDANSNVVNLNADGNNCYYFDMPSANVTITPVWGTV